MSPISLEPPPHERDPSTGHPLILYDYAEGGKPVWKEHESTEELLGKTVRRIWEDKGGLVNFSELQLESAIAREEASDDAQPVPQDAQHGDEDQVMEESDIIVDPDLDPEQMKAFKLAITDRLREASHSLGTFNLILSLILPSNHVPAASLVIPPEVPVPPSSFSATHILHKPGPSIDPLDDLATKQAALREMADVFKTSGDELGKVVAKAEGEWRVALGAREQGGFAVGLRGVERAFMGGDGKRDARDWVGWYGLDTAPPSFRHRHYAHLSAPEASSSASSSTPRTLIFPNRTRRRLQVTLTRTVNGHVTSSSSQFLARPQTAALETSDDVGKEAAEEMESAMWEAVEEETFAEVIAEARQLMHTLPSRVSHNSLKVEVSPGLDLTIALVTPSSTPEATTFPNASSAYPTLLSTLLVQSLLSLHSHRSTHIALASQPVRDPRVLASHASRPKILQGVVEVAQLQGLEQRVRGLVDQLAASLRDVEPSAKGKERERSGGIGLSVKVQWEGQDEGWQAVEVGGRSGVRVRQEGRKGVLTVEDGPPITIHVLPPLRLNLILPSRHRNQSSSTSSTTKANDTVVTLTDLAHLASCLELEIKGALLRSFAAIPSSSSPEEKGKVEGFVDRLQGIALLQWEGGEIRLDPRLSLAPATFLPTLVVRAVLRSIKDPIGREEVFDSSVAGSNSAGGVLAWARGIWIGRDKEESPRSS